MSETDVPNSWLDPQYISTFVGVIATGALLVASWTPRHLPRRLDSFSSGFSFRQLSHTKPHTDGYNHDIGSMPKIRTSLANLLRQLVLFVETECEPVYCFIIGVNGVDEVVATDSII
ncbi:hypothetical protein [Natronomonas marina]|jgi:hypothetical protein|uniref:hypothetical protein n=1 Tax=Natronomonas marina TaxID=2961939 RepID=UPI003D9C846C